MADNGGAKKSDPHRDVTGALHDVSNALTVMLGWLGEARGEGATRETIDHALRIIEQRAKAARDLARRAIGASIAPDEEQSVGAVVSDAIAALAVEAQRARVRITLEAIGAEHARARVVAGDVSQILTNLLMNAIAHAPRGSEIKVGIAAHETQVTIDVIDAGPGVAEARRDSIFDGDSAREGGAGVGLRHARAMARASGGELDLLDPNGAIEGGEAGSGRSASRPPRQGAHFRLAWPRADALPPAPRSVPRMQLFEGTHVLVVEDDLHVTQLLEAALVARGALVTIARTARELETALEAPGPPHDAVLIDLSPIQANPDGAIASLRARAPKATMVVISGSAEELPEPLRDGSVQFVRKPFEVGEIVSALAHCRLPKG